MNRRIRILIGVALVELIIAPGLLAVAYRPMQRERAAMRIGAWQGEDWVANYGSRAASVPDGSGESSPIRRKGDVVPVSVTPSAGVVDEGPAGTAVAALCASWYGGEDEYMPPCKAANACPRYPTLGSVRAGLWSSVQRRDGV